MQRVDAVQFVDVEWDEAKRQRTLSEREIDFADAAIALLNHHLETSSDREGESRTLAICEIGDQIAGVVYTMRGEVCRIISVRAARRYERREYRSVFAE